MEWFKKLFKKKNKEVVVDEEEILKYPFRAPHCDELVLHAPGICSFCDKLPELQKLRVMWKINFTGQNKKDYRKCPAELRRKVETINKWYGNVPHDSKK